MLYSSLQTVWKIVVTPGLLLLWFIDQSECSITIFVNNNIEGENCLFKLLFSSYVWKCRNHQQRVYSLKNSSDVLGLHNSGVCIITIKMYSFLSFWSENDQKVSKMTYFMQFWPIFGPYELPKAPYTTKEVH